MKKAVFPLIVIFILFEIVWNSEFCKNAITNQLARILISINNIEPPIGKKLSSDTFIAHAGGNIDGYLYTNSRESVENALKNGFNFIEIDFSVTRDGHLAAVHDWKSFGQITGVHTDTALTIEEVKNRNIHNKYHTLSGKDIANIMKNNQDMIIITDKIKDIKLLSREIPFKERILVEVFNRIDYIKCLWYGFYPVYSLPWKNDDLNKIMGLEASWYTLPGIFWKKSHVQLREYAAELCQQGKEVLLYTAGSPSDVNMESDDFLNQYMVSTLQSCILTHIASFLIAEVTVSPAHATAESPARPRPESTGP